jgi:hypothetical protein
MELKVSVFSFTLNPTPQTLKGGWTLNPKP